MFLPSLFDYKRLLINTTVLLGFPVLSILILLKVFLLRLLVLSDIVPKLQSCSVNVLEACKLVFGTSTSVLLLFVSSSWTPSALHGGCLDGTNDGVSKNVNNLQNKHSSLLVQILNLSKM